MYAVLCFLRFVWWLASFTGWAVTISFYFGRFFRMMENFADFGSGLSNNLSLSPIVGEVIMIIPVVIGMLVIPALYTWLWIAISSGAKNAVFGNN